jgi:UDP-N-acetylmuramate dehydrogenase
MTIPSCITQNASLTDKTWFETGGSAAYLAQPTTAEELQEALAFAHSKQLPIEIIGHGANILVSDAGYQGLLVRSQFTTVQHTIQHDTAQVTAGSGVSFGVLIEYCLNNSLLGLEEFSGIPGSVGGSVYINIHYYEFLLEQFFHSARVLDLRTGEIMQVDKHWFAFGYDYSKLHEKQHIVLDATFNLRPARDSFEVAYARGRSTEITRHRYKRYPHKGTCGSFFRNFHEHEVTLESGGRKMIFSAYYLDKMGVKGTLRVGNAVVSHQHANMLVNLGGATTADIIAVARIMQEKVLAEFGILLQPECQLLGFTDYPLLQAAPAVAPAATLQQQL